MSTATIYARIPSELKERVTALAGLSGKQLGETLEGLIGEGLLFPETQREFNETRDKLSKKEDANRSLQTELERNKADLKVAQQRLEAVERARGHLERILNTEVGRCTVPNCGATINLYSFVYQQCPQGHAKKIELYDEYKKAPGVGDAVVAGLALIGGVALAAELLGDKKPNGNT